MHRLRARRILAGSAALLVLGVPSAALMATPASAADKPLPAPAKGGPGRATPSPSPSPSPTPVAGPVADPTVASASPSADTSASVSPDTGPGKGNGRPAASASPAALGSPRASPRTSPSASPSSSPSPSPVAAPAAAPARGGPKAAAPVQGPVRPAVPTALLPEPVVTSPFTAPAPAAPDGPGRSEEAPGQERKAGPVAPVPEAAAPEAPPVPAAAGPVTGPVAGPLPRPEPAVLGPVAPLPLRTARGSTTAAGNPGQLHQVTPAVRRRSAAEQAAPQRPAFRRPDPDGGAGVLPGRDVLPAVGSLVRSSVERPALPLGILVVVIGFLLVQHRIDRRDPKLARVNAWQPPDLIFRGAVRPA